MQGIDIIEAFIGNDNMNTISLKLPFTLLHDICFLTSVHNRVHRLGGMQGIACHFVVTHMRGKHNTTLRLLHCLHDQFVTIYLELEMPSGIDCKAVDDHLSELTEETISMYG